MVFNAVRQLRTIEALDTLELTHGPFVRDISRIERGPWLQEEQMDFFVGHRHMLDAVRHDNKFAFLNDRIVIAESHAQGSFHHQEQLVFDLVMMPDELAPDFHRFYLAVV
jgi:hypothetical protein